MGKRKKLCLVTISPETNHPQKVSRGVFAQCEKYGYDVAQFASMINFDFYFDDYKQGEKNIYELVNYSLFDGIILDSVSMTGDINLGLAKSVCRKIKEQTSAPVVCVGVPLSDFETVDNSNEQQLREICRHIIELHGCRDICVLTGTKDNHEAEQRLEIILDELTDDDELAVCVVDMDGLKYINDTFGHSDGDYGIKLVSEAVQFITESKDVCARAGGDEFYIAGIRRKGSFDPKACTEAFCSRLSELTKNDSKPFTVTASIGCAVGEGKDIDFDELLAEADEEMYRFKLMRKRQRR